MLMLLVSMSIGARAQASAQMEWFDIHDGDAHAVDIPNAATLDRRGNHYITGRSGGIGAGQDYLTLKYSPSGALLLAVRHTGLGTSWDEATAIAVDDVRWNGIGIAHGVYFYHLQVGGLITTKKLNLMR
jgi:hypothetical protein